jgi:protein gp37
VGEHSAIQWCDHTWNPWVGCTKVSPGCKFCYMYVEQERRKVDPDLVRETSTPTFNGPLKRWGPKGGPNGERAGTYKWADGTRVFTCSYSDFFHSSADEWRPRAFGIMRVRTGLTFQVLTKRPQLVPARLPEGWGAGFPNVWVGTSTEDGKWLAKRTPALARIPAALRFLSIEPLLEYIATADLHAILEDARIGWVIVGGESELAGTKTARWCDPRWISNVVEACDLAGVPVFVKQLGSAWAREEMSADRPNSPGDRKGGHDLDRWPDDLRVRQFPTVLR